MPVKTLSNYTPEQTQLFQSLFGQVGPGSFLSNLASGDQSQFEALERPAMRQFQELQGGLASRFSGAFGPGQLSARRGSGFQNTTNQATQDFASQLQSHRMGLQSQALKDLFGMSESLLNQRPYEHIYEPKQRGGGLGGILSGLAGGALGSFMGPLGMAGGSALGSRLFGGSQDNDSYGSLALGGHSRGGRIQGLV